MSRIFILLVIILVAVGAGIWIIAKIAQSPPPPVPPPVQEVLPPPKILEGDLGVLYLTRSNAGPDGITFHVNVYDPVSDKNTSFSTLTLPLLSHSLHYYRESELFYLLDFPPNRELISTNLSTGEKRTVLKLASNRHIASYFLLQDIYFLDCAYDRGVTDCRLNKLKQDGSSVTLTTLTDKPQFPQSDRSIYAYYPERNSLVMEERFFNEQDEIAPIYSEVRLDSSEVLSLSTSGLADIRPTLRLQPYSYYGNPQCENAVQKYLNAPNLNVGANLLLGCISSEQLKPSS